MQNQVERANLLNQLHRQGDPLILFNIWDAGSARTLQEAGAKAIATGSWGVAAAQGYEDGEKMPLDEALSNLRRIVASVDLPVTLDFEAGYGHSPAQVQASVTRALADGAVGINFEDQIIGQEGLYSIEDQCARIQAVRAAADQTSIPLFINARTDLFLKLQPAQHTDAHLQEATQRARAYAGAGASGFFAPGLRDAQRIKRLCELAPLPVNILIMPDVPTPRELAQLGVARISYGAGPYRQMMAALKVAGRQALAMI